MRTLLVIVLVLISLVGFSQTNKEKRQGEIPQKKLLDYKRSERASEVLNKQLALDAVSGDTSNLPAHVTQLELRRYEQAAKIERENLSTKKSLREVLVSEDGLEGIIGNDYFLPITFILRPLNGGEKAAFLLESKTRMTVDLIPGDYLVHFFNGGREVCLPVPMRVSLQRKFYKGESCHWFIYMPRM